jgi:UDP-glucose 4-epimerase
MRVLVTGGSGLVGRYVVDELSKTHDVLILDLKDPHRTDLGFVRADVLDLDAMKRNLSGFDAVVHLAGIPHPLNDPPEKVFRVNTIGTFNLLEACLENGVRSFVLMSSESTLGFAFSSTKMAPVYLPIDELHPLRPQDPYGLSKVTCETLCQGFSRRSDLRTICLRAPWIWVPEEKERDFYRRLVAEYHQWSKNLWAFVHVFDVAQAVRLSLEARLAATHEQFFITADNNWTGRKSRMLSKEFYPETTDLRSDFQESVSFISCKKAKGMLRFTPQHTTDSIL